jgi:glycosyltransferase involved in cell wall biosynthesis
MPKAVLLGPHPGTASFSILKYFHFFRCMLPQYLPGWHLSDDSPGLNEISTDTPAKELGSLQARWESYGRWPLHLTKVRADCVHIVDQGLAWYGEFIRGGRRLVTVHDLIGYMQWKGAFGPSATLLRKKLLLSECVRQIKRADHIVSSSHCTAAHLMSYLGISAGRITVVHNPVETSFSPLSVEEKTAARKRWFGEAEAAVIHVGQAISYKNRIGALRAFVRVKRALPAAQMFLVHGPPDREERAFLTECEEGAAIHFLPPVTRSELREFYGAADVLLFPSLYEGFGWPPLEAMACGCPVVCTTRGSLPEVVSDAALKVDDPHNYDALADAVRAILTDASAASDLRNRGFERVRHFAPEKILPQMAEVYRVLGAGA